MSDAQKIGFDKRGVFMKNKTLFIGMLLIVVAIFAIVVIGWGAGNQRSLQLYDWNSTMNTTAGQYGRFINLSLTELTWNFSIKARSFNTSGWSGSGWNGTNPELLNVTMLYRRGEASGWGNDYVTNTTLNCYNATDNPNVTNCSGVVTFSAMGLVDTSTIEFYFRMNTSNTDGNGSAQNGTQADPFIVTVDTTFPTISLEAPANISTNITSNIDFLIIPTDTNLLNCTLYINGTGVGGSPIANSSNTSPTSAATNILNVSLADGVYSWTANCYDKANNIFLNHTGNHTLYVDTTDPEGVSINVPQVNTSSTNPEYRSAAFILNATANDTVSGVYRVVYRLYNTTNSTAWSSNMTLAGTNNKIGNWSANTVSITGLNDGNYTLEINASDRAKTDTYDNSHNVTSRTSIVIDTTAPVITAASIDNNTCINNTNNLAFNINITESNLNTSMVYITYNSTGVTDISDSAMTCYGQNSSSLGIWTRYWCTKSVDLSGSSHGDTVNVYYNATDAVSKIDWYGDNFSSPTKLTIDIYQPNASLNIPAAERTNYSANISINVTVYDNTSRISQVQYKWENATITTGNWSSNMSWNGDDNKHVKAFATLNISDLQDGIYNLTINATDRAGNSNITNKTIFIIDRTGPVITISSPINKSYNGTTVEVNVSSTEVVSFWIYSLDAGTTNVTFVNDTNPALANRSFTFTEDGNINLTIYANDTSGQWGIKGVLFRVDTTGPTLTLVSPTNISYNNVTSVNGLIWINITSTENLSGLIMKYNTTNQTLMNSTNPALMNRSFTFNLTWLNQSSNVRLIIYGNDTAGRAANTTVYFNIDTNAPNLTVIRPQNTTYTNVTIWLNFTAPLEDISTLIIKFNGTNLTWANETNTGLMNRTFTFNESGNINLTVYANDTANNWKRENITFRIDTVGPNITIVSPKNESYYYFNTSSAVWINATVTGENATGWIIEWNGTNQTLANITNWDIINRTFTFNDSQSVQINLTIHANDSWNNWDSANVKFEIDVGPPGLTSWTYSTVTRNVTMTFNDTMDASSIDLTKFNITDSNGSTTASLEGFTNSRATGYVYNTNGSDIVVQLTALQDVAFRALTGTQQLDVGLLAINDTASNALNTSHFNTAITTYTRWTIRRPETGYLGSSTNWTTFSLSTNAIDSASSITTNNISEILKSISGSYTIIYAYNWTAGGWISFMPGRAGNTFLNFTTEADGRAYEIHMNKSDAIEIS